MKKLSVFCFCLLLISAIGFSNAFAASAKATSSAGDLATVRFNSAAKIFEQKIHTASQKDLFIDVSLECGLTTNTKVMSKALKRAISEAEATVKVWVEVDGKPAAPGVVTFARRYQGLIAEFAGAFSTDKSEWQACFVTDSDTGITTIDETCLTEEMLALILDTMTANSFDFIMPDLAAGDHTVTVYADLSYQHTGQEFVDSADLSKWAPEDITTRAYIGKGSVTIESVRMVKGDGPADIE
jgi:hypothetical protein